MSLTKLFSVFFCVFFYIYFFDFVFILEQIRCCGGIHTSIGKIWTFTWWTFSTRAILVLPLFSQSTGLSLQHMYWYIGGISSEPPKVDFDWSNSVPVRNYCYDSIPTVICCGCGGGGGGGGGDGDGDGDGGGDGGGDEQDPPVQDLVIPSLSHEPP